MSKINFNFDSSDSSDSSDSDCKEYTLQYKKCNSKKNIKKTNKKCTKSNGDNSKPGTWTLLKNQYPGTTDADPSISAGISSSFLLTDGSLIVFPNSGTNKLYKLSPDSNGSYVNGVWSYLTTFPDYKGKPFSPDAFATGVMADGKVIFCGGETNAYDGSVVESNLCTLYDPVSNTFKNFDFPQFFDINPNVFGLFDIPGFNGTQSSQLGPGPFIGDGQCSILEDGTFMLACSWGSKSALLDYKTLTWSQTGANKFGTNHEEGWVLLPGKDGSSGKLLNVCCYVGIESPQPLDQVKSELYNPETKKWESGPDLVEPVQSAVYITGGPDLGASGSYPYPDHEIGGGVLRPDGTVLWLSGEGSGTNAIYDVNLNKWKKGTNIPFVPGVGQFMNGDRGGALLPNGNVLFGTAVFFEPFLGSNPGKIFEYTLYDDKIFDRTPDPSVISIDKKLYNFVLLPTGEVFCTDINQCFIYKTGNDFVDPDWKPIITKCESNLNTGNTYKISGIRLNGMSQGYMEGDDNVTATNWPLVRITNNSDNTVCYCRTHDHSFMGVASNKKVYTYFDIPSNISRGNSKLEVVCNGISSDAIKVCVS